MRASRSVAAFTLIELLTAAGVFGVVTVALLSFTSTSLRFFIRNIATNHSHDVARIAAQRIIADMHDSASRFVLINFNGTTYSDVTPVTSSDLDPLSGKYISARANGVRYYTLGGGPYKLSANTDRTDTSLTFNFGVNGGLPYVPQTGDRLVLPLLDREFKISGVTTTPTAGSPTGRITLDDGDGIANLKDQIGFTIKTDTGNATVAYFYRMVAYTAYNGELRYHANYTGSAKSNFQLVRNKVTSPKPFALLFTASGATDALYLRVSLETAETDYSARRLLGSTSTLQSVVPPRNIPPQVASTQ